MFPVSDKGASAFNHANALKLIQKDIYQAQEEYEAAHDSNEDDDFQQNIEHVHDSCRFFSHSFLFLQTKYRSKIDYTSKPFITVTHKSTPSGSVSILYESVYENQKEAKSNKYAESNYGCDNSSAYFRRQKKQRNDSRNYKNYEKQITPYLFNSFHFNVTIAQKYEKSTEIDVYDGRQIEYRSRSKFPV